MSSEKGYTDYTVTAFGHELTGKDAIDFLHEKTGTKACLACGHSPQSIMLTGPADQSAMVITTRDSLKGEGGDYEFNPDPNTRALPVFGLWCPNCGHVQLHTLATLSLWVGDKGESSENNTDGPTDDDT